MNNITSFIANAANCAQKCVTNNPKTALTLGIVIGGYSAYDIITHTYHKAYRAAEHTSTWTNVPNAVWTSLSQSVTSVTYVTTKGIVGEKAADYLVGLTRSIKTIVGLASVVFLTTVVLQHTPFVKDCI